MLIAGCVLLEYGVAVSAVAVGWSGYFNELLHHLFGCHDSDRPVAVVRAGATRCRPTGGVINLPA